jgi:lipopolysaccharide heptosyltransferase II
MKPVQIDKTEIRNIIVIKPRAIGDVLLSTAVLPNLRREFDDARIDFLAESFASPVLQDNPFVDDVVTYDTRNESSLSIILKVRRKRYDLVIDLFSNPRTAVITMLSGAKYRVGFPFKWRRLAYNIIVPPRSGSVHNVEFNLDALRRIGIPVETQSPSFFLDSESERFAADFMSAANLASGSFISFNIGGGWATKRWPAEKFVELSKIIGSTIHQPVVVLYGPSEEKEAEGICRSSGAILAPQTSLKQMGALLKSSRLLVTNDSGPMHIAAALGVPTLAIFGPTNPRLQGPYGNISEIVRNEKLDCLECNLTECPIGNLCMKELEPATVFEHLLKLISKIDERRTATSSIAKKGAAKTDENV